MLREAAHFLSVLTDDIRVLPMTRNAARARALHYVDSGAFEVDLARLVACASISQSEGTPEIRLAYLTDEIGPLLTSYGFQTEIFGNPDRGGPPLMLAERFEATALPTVLIYGHGDVCNGEAERWRQGLTPFQLTRDGDKLYGRGTADNKGQHLINITCLGLLIKANGSLGFNVKVLIEMGEEMGSPGLRQFMFLQRERLSADVLIASDGPRLVADHPTMFMGSRGAFDIAFSVNLRDKDYHSGNFGGLLADPAILLAHAIACVTDQRGQISIPEWRPDSLTADVREILAKLPHRMHDEAWGEADLTPSERVFGWNSFAVLAMSAGNIRGPQSAISGSASAVGQLRFVVGTNVDDIVPALRSHLDAKGFQMVAIEQYGEVLHATRFSLNHPWVDFVCQSITQSLGVEPHILPNLAGSLPNDMFTDVLKIPTIWVPHSYADCGQHGPNEHALLSIAREGMQIMTDIYLDIAERAPTKAG